jgi:hypothetical protein
MFVYSDLFKISLLSECRGYSKIKSVFKGYDSTKRLGTPDLDQDAFLLLYKSLVRLHLKYANVI